MRGGGVKGVRLGCRKRWGCEDAMWEECILRLDQLVGNL